ncbi:MAG TPA: hypothetical protein VLK65_20205 [Vicinamibacteria bacterium]|nr:hypothetical protein [Vicinamibacteria bacterium]
MRQVLIPAIRACDELPLPTPPGDGTPREAGSSSLPLPSLASEEPTQDRSVLREEK